MANKNIFINYDKFPRSAEQAGAKKLIHVDCCTTAQNNNLHWKLNCTFHIKLICNMYLFMSQI